MISIYSASRNIYICKVNKALKDNPVVKKGEPYIWVKATKFSNKEFFKDEEDLEKKYPIIYKVSRKQIETLLRGFKKELKENNRLSPKKFLNGLL